MSWSEYGRLPYGGRATASSPAAGGISVPGYDSVYYWSLSGAANAYGQAAYGGRTATTYPSAGLFAAPDPTVGVITVPLWWAFAEFATLTRVDAETGERSPVRGSPVALPGPSRRNAASNPKARDSLVGYSEGANTSLSRLTGLTTGDPDVTTAVRMSATAAGQVSVTFSLDPTSPASTTYGFFLATSASATGAALSVDWYDSNSQLLGTSTYPVASDVVTAAASRWAQAVVTVANPSQAAATGVVSLVVTGLPAGATADFTARITEVGDRLGGDYFDGDDLGAAWIGTPGLSYSDISPLVPVTDLEAPLDRPVFYELTNPVAPGYVAASEAVTLVADGLRPPRDTLLTHPGLNKTVRVWIETEPDITNALEQSSFQVLGRRRKVVISAPQRGGDEGELIFVTESMAEYTLLRDMLDDGSPLLLRTPAAYGHPPLWWLAFADLSRPASASGAANTYATEVRRLKASFTEVDRPSAATRPLVA